MLLRKLIFIGSTSVVVTVPNTSSVVLAALDALLSQGQRTAIVSNAISDTV